MRRPPAPPTATTSQSAAPTTPEPATTPEPTTPEPATPSETEAAPTQAAEPAPPPDPYTDVDLSLFPMLEVMDMSGEIQAAPDYRGFFVDAPGAAYDVNCVISAATFSCSAQFGWEFCESVGIASGVGALEESPAELMPFCPGEGASFAGELRYLEPMERIRMGDVVCSNDGSILTCENSAAGTKVQVQDGRIILTEPHVEY